MQSHSKALYAVAALCAFLLVLPSTALAADPTFTVDPPSNVTYTSAELSGEVDPEDNELYYYFQYSQDPEVEGWNFGPEAFLHVASGTDPVAFSEELSGLKAGAEYKVRIATLTTDETQQWFSPEPYETFTTLAVDPPSVTIDPITTFTGTTATFEGTIDPEAPEESPGEFPAAFDVKWHFECTPACRSVEFVNPNSEFPQPLRHTIEADSDPHEVEAHATDLDPNTSYEVRFVAENKGGTAQDETSFTTATEAPFVETLPPAVIDDTSAWIGGKVNPRNSPTTYFIELADNPSFTNSTQFLGSENGEAGSGNELLFANHHAEGLQPNTTYYYRVVASGAGSATGETESLTTRAEPFAEVDGLSEGRVYEKVSPADKNGAEIRAGSNAETVTQASVSGDGVAFSTHLVSFGGEGASFYSQYVARRTEQGWRTSGVSPRITPGFAVFQAFSWLSDDLSDGVVSTHAALNAGDLPQTDNLYLRDNEVGSYESIVSPANVQGQRTTLRGVSGDGQHFVYVDGPGNLAGQGSRRLWKWSDGVNREVGVIPDETSVPATLGASSNPVLFAGENPVSEDGSRVYFRLPETSSPLYLRDFSSGSGETLLVSGSERTGDDPNVPLNARFELASGDGRIAFFISPDGLTDQSSIPWGRRGSGTLTESLYRWDADAPLGDRLTDIAADEPNDSPQVLGTAGASEDASTVYFGAKGKLTPDAVSGAPNLYVWREGKGVELVATVSARGSSNVWSDVLFNEFTGDSGSQDNGTFRQARVTPDGRYISFVTWASLTAYDTNNTPQMYLYDSATGDLQCVSCGVAEPKSSGGAWFTSGIYRDRVPAGAGCCSAPSRLGYLSRSLSDDGSRIVFDSADPLVPGDSNGTMDVYQWKEGQLSLISSGSGKDPSQLIDVSAAGRDVFFTTTQQLVPSDADPDRDLYDARIGGRAEIVPDLPCVADECQGTPMPPPGFSTPSSAGFKGPGSAKSAPGRCAKGKVRRKSRCVARKKRKNRNASSKARRHGQGKQGRNH